MPDKPIPSREELILKSIHVLSSLGRLSTYYQARRYWAEFQGRSLTTSEQVTLKASAFSVVESIEKLMKIVYERKLYKKED
jgi:hypothetical protein